MIQKISVGTRVFILATLAVCSSSCETSELQPIPLPIGGGGGSSSPARTSSRNQPSTFYPVENSIPDESVTAPNIKEATRKCQERADELSREKGKTIVFINVRRSVISGAYVCQFQEL